MDISAIEFDFISEDTLLLRWPEQVCRQQHRQIIKAQQHLTNERSQFITDTLVSFNSLLIYYRYPLLSANQLQTLIEQALANRAESHATAQEHANPASADDKPLAGKQISIPTYYDEQAGWDLTEVMQTTGLSQQAIIAKHSEPEYYAYALGFSPGFAYLASLNSQLQMPRKAIPRKQMPAGAVAIAGEQTAVYPDATPGGWHIIGQCPVSLYQVTDTGIESVIKVGDSVRFTPIDRAEFIALGGTLAKEQESIASPISEDLNNSTSNTSPPEKNLSANSRQQHTPLLNKPLLTVNKGAARVSLQDLGRKHCSQYGVSPSGAADEYALMTANQILGNTSFEAALEILLGDVEIVFYQACELVVAAVGDEQPFILNNEAKPMWQRLCIQAGDTLNIAPFRQGNYAYLSIKGGFATSSWFESAIAKLNAPIVNEYFANQPLAKAKPDVAQQVDSQVTSQIAAQPVKNLRSYSTFYPAPELACEQASPFIARFIANKAWQNLSDYQQEALLNQVFTIDISSNKMGYRLNRQGFVNSSTNSQSAYQALGDSAGTISKPVTYGQIQLPSAKQWIVLMKDRQTIGGYPSIGSVMKTDLFRLAQLKPNYPVRFQPISLAQAQVQLAAFYQRFGNF
ncbi:5-oxoprolinase subunit PxpB [Thalassotalea euphylliae]|uniref:5-oxoprolinase subunit PxpB n=1 Tax=Thalassotalea euphylliae TaxID=1655234 RepID=A0A3E0UB53_9GAMM|nr:5-oxoprolinase subunit PxpB [Thalassotalea euphylliae]REL34166.1 5-oxoprolinase subunit PxpB [Thalassotalea euphylliae]